MQNPVSPLVSFFLQTHVRDYAENETVYTSENPEQSIFYLYDGFVKSYTITASGGASVLAFYGPDAMFPLRPALKRAGFSPAFRYKSTVYFEAMTPVSVYKRRLADFQGFIEAEPIHYREIVYRLLRNLEMYASRSESLEYRYARERLVYQLLTLANLFGDNNGGVLRISIPLTHQDIAESIGMARETVSREMEQLKQSGLIASENKHIRLLDIDQLNQIII